MRKSPMTTHGADGGIDDNGSAATLPFSVQQVQSPSPLQSHLLRPEVTEIPAAPPGRPPPVPPRSTLESRRPMPGILRLDMSKPRRSSGGSVEFRAQPLVLGEDNSASPTGVSSPHQLTVTWATPCDIDKSDSFRHKSMQSHTDAATIATATATAAAEAAEAEAAAAAVQGTTAGVGAGSAAGATFVSDRLRRSNTSEERPYDFPSSLTSPVDAIDFPLHQQLQQQHFYEHSSAGRNDVDAADDDEDEEDYSISVSAIMQRRASVRGYRNKRGSRNSRRTSSPMDHVLDTAERRRSSVYTTSSEDGTNQESTQEQIFENIRLHKEVIQSVKLQPWPMRKKLKLVRQAKTYVARHEGALQERFAMSRSTRDLWARFKILMAARWRHWKRETASFLTVLIPWELRIKEIESHFGSGVASYFTFLRWLMWVNIMIAIPLVAFVIGPEYFATKNHETDPRKKMSEKEFKVAGNLFTFWEFEGYLKYSPMFYGYYSSFSGASSLGYQLPLAYFLTAVVVYIYSFVATLRKMAENSRNSKLSSKDDECTFSWKLFTGWDFMIGHAETAHNRIASVVVGFKEALLEEAEKKKDNRNWRIILQRILVNILVMGLLAASGYTVVALVNNAEALALKDNWLSRNAVNVTMTLLSFFLPMIFEALGLFENWHPRQQLRLQLARIMILNMLNLYSLMFSFIYNINSKERPLQDLKSMNESATQEFAMLTALIEGIRAATTTTTTTTLSPPPPTASGLLGNDYSTLAAFGEDSSSSVSSSASTTVDYGGGLSSTTESLYSTTAAAAAAALYSAASTRLKCYNITVKCSKPTRIGGRGIATTTLLLLNMTTLMWTPTPAPTPTPTPSSTTTAATMTETELWTTAEVSTLPTTTPQPPTTTTTTIWTTMPPEWDATTMTTPPFPSSSDYSDSSGTSETVEEDNTSTLPATTSTTTISPGNDSFFDYYDYFVGMPIDSSNEAAAPDEVEEEKPASESARRRRQVAMSTATARADEAPRQSNGRTPETTTTTTTTAKATTAPSKTTTTLLLPTTTTVLPSNDSTESDALWVTSEQLQQVLAYFTTTTTTIEPPPTTSTTTIGTTATTSAATTTTETMEPDYGESTPFFIGSDGDTGEPNYYDIEDVEEQLEDYGYCIRTVCEALPNDASTTSAASDALSTPASGSSSTEVAVAVLTTLERHEKRLRVVNRVLSEVQRNLTSMCWETSLGQELSKVIVFDGIMSIVAPLCIDFLRALFVRYVNQRWCWDMEKTFPQYGDFKIAENILTLINNQGQVWMGIFFSPGLVLINLVKLVIMMYFRSWIVLTCNVPHEVVFKASKSNNFYLSLLLTMLFLCVLPVGYAVVWLRPSWHCGPFSDYNRISEFITNTTRNALPKQLHEPLDYLTSSSTVIPLLLLLILIIYYLVSLTGALREANQDLRTQLQKEREEERKKIFKVPESKPAEPTTATLTNRWRKVLEASSPLTPTQQPDFETEEYKSKARKELISRIMKEALRKGSATSEDDSVVRRDNDDDTDTEHHDSLPLDEEGKEKRFGLSKLQQIRRTRKPSLVDIVQIAKNQQQQMASGKESHPKSRFKLDKTDKKDKEREKDKELKEKEKEKEKEAKQSPDSGNDPENNSRIVNERRESLLRRKREDDDNAMNKTVLRKYDDHTGAERHLDRRPPPVDEQSNSKTSNFAIVDEKKSVNGNGSGQPSAPSSQPARENGVLFKMRRNKGKLATATSAEPNVFKFDERSVKESPPPAWNVVCAPPGNVTAAQSAGHLRSESHAPAPHSSEDITTPPATPGTTAANRANQADKLVNFSRQGRKKIGSLLALVREAVNTRRSEDEHSTTSDHAVSISAPPQLATKPTQAAATMAKTKASIASSPQSNAYTVPSALEAGSPVGDAITCGTNCTINGPPKLAPLEDPEELDRHGPIVFPLRTASQRRRERPMPARQDSQISQTSIWSTENIPTITISTTGSEECIVEEELGCQLPSAPAVNIIKIKMDNE